MLEERQILLSLRETDLEVWEAKLVEEQAYDLRSFNGRDLSAKLEELPTRTAGVEDECAAEAREMSMLVF
jgi:hypothetical protein